MLDTSEGDGAEDIDDVLAKGTSIGRYLVLERLGAGAMGVVYAAYDPELDRKIAIKLLRPEEGKGDRAHRQERLVREAKAIAKLSHPNVVGIFDVGVHDGQVFLAMEYLGGGTLRDWVAAKKRPWREIVKMFIDVGHGLAAAHAEGLIHRDFKPDNVLLDKQGKPKVVDFGLVHLTSAALETSATGSVDSPLESTAEVGAESAAATPLAALTRTGAMTGTPAYMAPEQFLGKPIDARTDQFAFCVALYEALYGQRPFTGETVMVLAGAVTAGRVAEAPKASVIPGWLRRILIRGLEVDPSGRFPEFELLLASLLSDPASRLRRRLAIAASVTLVVILVIGGQHRANKRRLEFERQISNRISEADTAQAQAGRIKSTVLELRRRAFKDFDEFRSAEGETIWGTAKSQQADVDRLLQQAQHALESAIALDPGRPELRSGLARLAVEQALTAEQLGDSLAATDLIKRVTALDPHGPALGEWNALGHVAVVVTPADAELVLERYVKDESGTRVPRVVAAHDLLRGTNLPPGSYRLTATAVGRAQVRLPFVLKRAERLQIELPLPNALEVPAGFVYIPAGKFLFGERDEGIRTGFVHSAPMHEVTTRSFIISRNEETFSDWIRFLEAQPRAAARELSPKAATPGLRGAVDLRRRNGRWALRLQPVSTAFLALQGAKIVYPGRQFGREQNWLQMPVVGVSRKDVEAFLRWKSSADGVAGARLCTEHEWERAARGADDRIYPHGDQLRGIDANIDETYGKRPDAYGLDEIGMHPRSMSPFDLQDMAGNAFELVDSSLAANETVARGGAYYYFRDTERSTNREVVEATMRNHMVGFRICADR